MLVAWRVLVWRSKARAGEFNHLPTFRASAPQEWQILSWLLTFLHPFYCYIGNMVVFPATNIPCDWKITFFWEVKGYLLAFFLQLWSWNSAYNRNRLHFSEDLFEAKHLHFGGTLWWDYDLKSVTWKVYFSKHQIFTEFSTKLGPIDFKPHLRAKHLSDVSLQNRVIPIHPKAWDDVIPFRSTVTGPPILACPAFPRPRIHRSHSRTAIWKTRLLLSLPLEESGGWVRWVAMNLHLCHEHLWNRCPLTFRKKKTFPQLKPPPTTVPKMSPTLETSGELGSGLGFGLNLEIQTNYQKLGVCSHLTYPPQNVDEKIPIWEVVVA